MLFYQNCAPPTSANNAAVNKSSDSYGSTPDESESATYLDPYANNPYAPPAGQSGSAGSSNRNVGSGESRSVGGGGSGGTTGGSGPSGPEWDSLCYAGNYAFSASEVRQRGRNAYLHAYIYVSDRLRVVRMPAGERNDLARKSCQEFIYGQAGSNPFGLPANCNGAQGGITFICRGQKYEIVSHDCSCTSYYDPFQNMR